MEKFQLISKSFDSISGRTNRELLVKWGMMSKLRTFTFTFDKQFHVASKNSFILEFFQAEYVINSIQKLDSSGKWTNLGVKASRVNVQDVSCSLLSIDIFDRLYEKNIVREDGSIRKCLDEYFEDVVVSDELRKMLLIEDSENYEMYSEAERDQFLFRLFKHICIGGEVCQYEDNVQPYIDVAKSIYKDLISVQKDAQTKNLKIVSYVYKVQVFDESNAKVYPNNTVIEQDFCYLIIDPYKRHIIVLYHRFDGPLFLE